MILNVLKDMIIQLPSDRTRILCISVRIHSNTISVYLSLWLSLGAHPLFWNGIIITTALSH